MTPENFQYLASALARESGLVLEEKQLFLLIARLAPLLSHQRLADLDALVAAIRKESGGELLSKVIEAIAANEACFFADRKSFDTLFEHALPAQMNSRSSERPLRIWSAGCGTGQEPYSVVLGVDQRVPSLRGWRVEVFATDINKSALERARQAIYNHFEVQRGLPAAYLVRYFAKAGKNYKLAPEIAARVQFHYQNLKADFAGLGIFDVILCRGVLSGFDAPTRADVLQRLIERLAPDGYLFLAPEEVPIVKSCRLERAPFASCVFSRPHDANPVEAQLET